MEDNKIRAYINDFPLFSSLKESEINQLISSSECIVFKKNDIVFTSGEQSKEIFLLFNGVVKITAKSYDNREVIKMILHPKSIMSELSLAGEDIRNNEGMVMTTEALVLKVKVELVKMLMRQNTELAMNIVEFIGRKLKYAEERLESLAMSDARERIVQFLKVNAESFGLPIGQETLLKHEFTQQDIASFTGTSRQTVTTVLNDLKKNNKIHFKRKAILIRDVAQLA